MSNHYRQKDDAAVVKDSELEARIALAYHQALCQRTSSAWALVAALIKQRSPEQVTERRSDTAHG